MSSRIRFLYHKGKRINKLLIDNRINPEYVKALEEKINTLTHTTSVLLKELRDSSVKGD